MWTSKFHALDHVVENIRKAGGTRYLNGALYEKSDKFFKQY